MPDVRLRPLMEHLDVSPGLPDRTRPPQALRLMAEWREAPARVRLMLSLYLAIGAWGGISGGYSLATEIPHPISYAISLLILEPVGFCCALGLITLYAPTALFDGFLAGAIVRAKVALLFIALAVVLYFGGVLIWCAWEWHQLSRNAARSLTPACSGLASLAADARR